MTVSNRGTNNSNSAYVSKEFEKQEITFRMKKEKASRKEKKGHNTNSLQVFEPPTHQRATAAFQAACTEDGNVHQPCFSSPAPEAEHQ